MLAMMLLALTAVVQEPTPPTIAAAQHLFYSARFADAAAAALAARANHPTDLEGYELRSSALLFQIKRVLEVPANPKRSLDQCASCARLMADFQEDVSRGLEIARARVRANAGDTEAMFYVGKLNLNWVWLHLGTLGRRTGWNQYWEARRSLEAVLKQQPDNVRAIVARAWIEYIVGTRVPRGTRWLLGGGNRTRALAAMRDAAAMPAERFVAAEAGFALWEMQVREQRLEDAATTARTLLDDFPANEELRRFVAGQRGTR
jgi:hypothetical protein